MATRPPLAGRSQIATRQRQISKAQADHRRESATRRGYGADWRRLRLTFLDANPLCRFCADTGRVEAATVVDHIITIADRPDLRLDWSNLRPLCKPCHDRHTAREQAFGGKASRRPEWLRPSAVPLHIVCGPPASGKTHWVSEHASADDLVLDLDEIAASLSGLGPHAWTSQWLDPALRERNELLGRLSRTSTTWPAAWLIISEPRAENRQWWFDKLRPETITVLETCPEICRSRIRHDPERADRIDAVNAVVLRWWSTYTRRPGETQIVTR